MGQHVTRNLAILFADVSGSTKLFETEGDTKARAAIAATLKILGEIVHQNDGKIVKTIGDEVMCVFSTAGRAATAAYQMQERLEEDNPAVSILESDTPLRVRVGFHFGPTLIEHGDVFGDSVNVAARMVAQAKGGQIITTHATIQLLDADMRENSRFVDHAPLKGKQGVIKIYEIIRQEEDVTHMVSGSSSAASAPSSSVALKVRYHGQLLQLSQTRPGLVMGRSQSCDLPIDESLASRQHVRIELRREKFYIVDQSTNGTFVQMKTIGETFLRREEVPITSSGRISLGRPFSEKPTEVVLFKPI